ncbi:MULTISPECIES: hypothetical protein [Paenibacillus]|uniref:Uncharacterized protein n=2 Tax=Paenibacillus TaxID=44249 RepID=A0AB36J6R7_9BACL|nr:hypothetical protein [Paenibacillus odorifer]OMD10636.1 hypothetical protein BJP50_28195 [Paenibacillus odorifer]OME07465.1 hypothetical protein BSK60_31515 [Paenibacillus odorifer]OME10275.1 hypothetical protein BSK47_31045 [Paenibacillus odorifer]
MIYLLLGVFDASAVIILALKLYRLPFREYIKDIALMSLGVSLFSYLMRIVIGIPTLDLPIQVIFFILFFRYRLKIKLFYSSLITSASLNAYIIVQLFILYGFIFAGTLEYNVVFQTRDLQIQLIQILSIIVSYLAAFLFHLFGWGFSFIIRPPHQFSIKEDYFSGENKALLLTTLSTLVGVSLALVITFNFYAFFLIPSFLIVYSISYYFSQKRDQQG